MFNRPPFRARASIADRNFQVNWILPQHSQRRRLILSRNGTCHSGWADSVRQVAFRLACAEYRIDIVYAENGMVVLLSSPLPTRGAVVCVSGRYDVKQRRGTQNNNVKELEYIHKQSASRGTGAARVIAFLRTYAIHSLAASVEMEMDVMDGMAWQAGFLQLTLRLEGHVRAPISIPSLIPSPSVLIKPIETWHRLQECTAMTLPNHTSPPSTFHPTSYTLHPTPHTLHPTLYTLITTKP
ncbi:hypothetical protein CIB48_g2738 [Xylaria polymorpha]|nr:hypothetical protein CIB48_g2738 [Xylaria polymorpha]